MPSCAPRMRFCMHARWFVACHAVRACCRSRTAPLGWSPLVHAHSTLSPTSPFACKAPCSGLEARFFCSALLLLHLEFEVRNRGASAPQNRIAERAVRSASATPPTCFVFEVSPDTAVQWPCPAGNVPVPSGSLLWMTRTTKVRITSRHTHTSRRRALTCCVCPFNWPPARA